MKKKQIEFDGDLNPATDGNEPFVYLATDVNTTISEIYKLAKEAIIKELTQAYGNPSESYEEYADGLIAEIKAKVEGK